MKILYTTNLSCPGNDCYIYKSVSLVEEFGMYTIITAEKITGWSERKDIYAQSNPTCDLEEAKFRFKKAGGIITD